MRRPTVVLWLGIGLLLGPIFAGAVAPIFWSYGSHTATAPEVARRLYQATRLNRTAEAFDHHLDGIGSGVGTSPCLQAWDLMYVRPDGDIDYTVVASGVRRFATTKMQIALDDPGEAALRDLPPPALGALQSCAFASPFSPACLAIARRIATRASSVSPAQRARIRELAERDAERIACKALRLDERQALAPAQRSSGSSTE